MQPVRISDVRKEYYDVVALEGVSLTVEPGTFHLLAGPNGSGKTSLLRLLLGLTTPSAGSVEVPDATVGPGFQRPTFYPDLTVETNLEVFGELVGADDAWRETVVDRLGLDRVAHREAAALSGGYQKKLDLALALVGEPDLALLDEPLGDLDDVTRGRVVGFLDDYAGDRGTVVVSSHRIPSFAPAIDRLTVLSRGDLVFDAADEDLADAAAEAGSVQALYEQLLADGAAADGSGTPAGGTGTAVDGAETAADDAGTTTTDDTTE